ncbi:MAG: four helix bundle protein [Phycisphaerales bacterium]|nr:four helix bundle protein [Phycisphaerales bacterium]
MTKWGNSKLETRNSKFEANSNVQNSKDETNPVDRNMNDEIEVNIMDGLQNKRSEDDGGAKRYDLEERTAVFGENVVRFAKKIPCTAVNERLIRQLVASGTSIGANYNEASDAESKKDFRHKIGICRKESKETKYWLRMIASSEPQLRDEAATMWQEAKELNLIFGAIRRQSDGV